MARPTKTDLLASPLKRFAESKAEVAIYDYYDGPFQFVESSILSLDGVDSDIEPLFAVLSEKDEVCVEIGAGDGRLFPALLSKSNRLIAYEKSLHASKLAMKKAEELSSVAQFQGAVSVVNDDFLTAASCDQTPSVFVLGSLSMNLFLEDEIDSLLKKCVQTAPHAALVFGVFIPDSVADFEKYDTRMDHLVIWMPWTCQKRCKLRSPYGFCHSQTSSLKISGSFKTGLWMLVRFSLKSGTQ